MRCMSWQLAVCIRVKVGCYAGGSNSSSSSSSTESGLTQLRAPARSVKHLQCAWVRCCFYLDVRKSAVLDVSSSRWFGITLGHAMSWLRWSVDDTRPWRNTA
jgi:hypothetical protein